MLQGARLPSIRFCLEVAINGSDPTECTSKDAERLICCLLALSPRVVVLCKRIFHVLQLFIHKMSKTGKSVSFSVPCSHLIDLPFCLRILSAGSVLKDAMRWSVDEVNCEVTAAELRCLQGLSELLVQDMQTGQLLISSTDVIE
jgi:hypothetical protein